MPEKTKILNLKREDFTFITQKVLNREKSLRFKAKGESMRPFIRNGDILEITPVNTEEIRLGDVIFYHVGKRRMVAHRVIEKIIQNHKPIFLTKGDSNTGEEEKVHLEQVVGRVKAIERKGRKIRINEGLNRLMYIFYLKISPFLTKARRIGGRLLRRIQGFKVYRNLAKRLVKEEMVYQWESFGGSGTFLLAKRSDKTIGRTTINNFLKADTHYHGWWIFGTWVDWRYRGLGVGSQLTEMLCEFAGEQEASEVKLLVFKDSKPALNLYRKLGFYQTHIPQIDEELGEEAKKTGRQRIIMKRDLAKGSGLTREHPSLLNSSREIVS